MGGRTIDQGDIHTVNALEYKNKKSDEIKKDLEKSLGTYGIPKAIKEHVKDEVSKNIDNNIAKLEQAYLVMRTKRGEKITIQDMDDIMPYVRLSMLRDIFSHITDRTTEGAMRLDAEIKSLDKQIGDAQVKIQKIKGELSAESDAAKKMLDELVKTPEYTNLEQANREFGKNAGEISVWKEIEKMAATGLDATAIKNQINTLKSTSEKELDNAINVEKFILDLEANKSIDKTNVGTEITKIDTILPTLTTSEVGKKLTSTLVYFKKALTAFSNNTAAGAPQNFTLSPTDELWKTYSLGLTVGAKQSLDTVREAEKLLQNHTGTIDTFKRDVTAKKTAAESQTANRTTELAAAKTAFEKKVLEIKPQIDKATKKANELGKEEGREAELQRNKKEKAGNKAINEATTKKAEGDKKANETETKTLDSNQRIRINARNLIVRSAPSKKSAYLLTPDKKSGIMLQPGDVVTPILDGNGNVQTTDDGPRQYTHVRLADGTEGWIALSDKIGSKFKLRMNLILFQNKTFRLLAIFLLFIFVSSLPLSLLAATERVSVADDESEAGAGSGTIAVSADGRYVAFYSGATNLVAGDLNAKGDIFVRDRTLGTTELVSVSSAGVQQNNATTDSRVAISSDGRYVIFMSSATNLVAGDTNGRTDVFLRDRQLGTTEIVSLADDESLATASVNSGVSLGMSSDGRYIIFISGATNLVAGDVNTSDDVFLRDRQLGTTEIVSLADDESLGNGNARTGLAVSSDGRYVAFQSLASNLVTGDSNAGNDTFVRDRTLGTTERVSISDGEAEANASIVTGASLAMSSDGRYVTFESSATNLVSGDVNARIDVFLRDRQLGTTEIVSLANDESLGDGDVSQGVSMSADGRYIAFPSAATNLITGDLNGIVDLFVRDRTLGTTRAATIANDDTTLANGALTTGNTSISANGLYTGYLSAATNLVTGDGNGFTDAFVQYVSGGGDVTAPVISDVASTTGETTATITWTTDEAASSSARFGLSTSYGTTSTSSATSTHSVSLSGLTANTLYHFALYAADASGNSATTTDYTFTTTSGAPTITNISSDKADGTYGPGETIDVDVTFSEAVTSTGSVTITLETGATDRTCTFTVSNSTSGTCNYTVQAGDNSLDLNVSSVSGTIKDADDNAMVSFSPATNLSTNKEIVIDGVAPNISSVATSTTTTTGTVDWITDESADSAVWYGTTSGIYTTSTSSATLRTTQSLTMTGLTSGTTYYFVAVSEDAYGNTATSTEYFLTTGTVPDTTPPVISNVASSTTTTTATITWTTGENASSTVNFGTTVGYGTASSSSSFVSLHSLTLTGLTPSTVYHFQVASGDASYNYATSSDYTFTTTDLDVTAPITGTYTVGAGELSSDLTVTAITSADVSDTSYNRSTSYTVPASPENLGDNANLVVAEEEVEPEPERSTTTTGSRAKSKTVGPNNDSPREPQNEDKNLCDFYLTGTISLGGINEKTEVEKLQKFLIENQKENITSSGVYDRETYEAVKRFQEKYKTEILLPWGLNSATGFVYTTTKAKINALHCAQTVSCPFFTEYAKVGETKDEVRKIKNFLNLLAGENILGDSGVFDALTFQKVKEYQNRYKDSVLTPWGLTSATGYWYKTTKASANKFMGCTDNPTL